MQNLTTLVDRSKADLCVGNSTLSKTLSMLNECLLNDLDHIVTASVDSTQMAEDFAELLQSQVAMKALIDELLLHNLPELIVLQVGGRRTLNRNKERTHSLPIQSGHLFLDHRHDHLPKVWALFKLILADEVETKHDLLGGHHFITEFLVDVHDVWSVLRVDQSEVDFVEDHGDVVVKVIVTTGMDTSNGNWGE